MKQPPVIKDQQMQMAINVLQVMEGGYFPTFVNMLRSWLDDYRRYGDTAEGVDMYRNQGSIQAFDHLIKEIDGNQDRYNKMQPQRSI